MKIMGMESYKLKCGLFLACTVGVGYSSYTLCNTEMLSKIILNLHSANLHISIIPHIGKLAYWLVDKVPVASTLQQVLFSYLTPKSNIAIGIYGGFVLGCVVWTALSSAENLYNKYIENKKYNFSDFLVATVKNVALAAIVATACYLVSSYTELDYYYTTLISASIILFAGGNWFKKNSKANSLYTGRLCNVLMIYYEFCPLLIVNEFSYGKSIGAISDEINRSKKSDYREDCL